MNMDREMQQLEDELNEGTISEELEIKHMGITVNKKNQYIADKSPILLAGLFNSEVDKDKRFDLAIESASKLYDKLEERGLLGKTIDIYNDPESKKEKIPYKEIVKLYHQSLSLPRVVKLSPQRQSYIRKLWRDKENGLPNLKEWEAFFHHIGTSDFLMGRTEKPFKCSLEWLTKPANYLKILENKYHGVD